MNNVFIISKDTTFANSVNEHCTAIQIKENKLTKKALTKILKLKTTDDFFVIQEGYDLPLLDYFPFDDVRLNGTDITEVNQWNDTVGILMFSGNAVANDIDAFTNDAMCDGQYKFNNRTYEELSKTPWPAYVIAPTKAEVADMLAKYNNLTYLKGTELTEKLLKKITKQDEKYFYVVDGHKTFGKNFNFNHIPKTGDEQYVSIYDESFGIMQFNNNLVKNDIDSYTALAFRDGQYALKFYESVIKNSFKATTYVLGKSRIVGATSLSSDSITNHTLNIIKRSCTTPYFYVVKEDTRTSINFDKLVPDYKHALTFWNGDDSVRLFKSDKVFENPKNFTDVKWFAGEITDVNNISDDDIDIDQSKEIISVGKMDIVLLANGWPDWCEKMALEYGVVTHIDSFSLGLKQINQILSRCKSEYIYVVTNYINCDGTFRFNYKPEKYDEQYMHIWNNDDSLRMFSRDMLVKDASYCTDQALLNNIAEVKNVNDTTVSSAPLDIVFMSYNEKNADDNYARLKKRFPYAKRVDGVTGIFGAHKAAAQLAGTHMFYVVDGDAVIDEDFDFDYKPNMYGQDCVYVWRSQNPCNGLEYGYGGVKLFPTDRVRKADAWRVDFTTSIARHFKVMPQVSNITEYNTDAFSAWRSGFREGAKLSSAVIENTSPQETKERIIAWTTVAIPTAPFAEESRKGALAGFEFGQLNSDMPNRLKLINDYTWLGEQYKDA